MNKSITPAQLEQLRRDAQRLKRAQELPTHEAQDRIAAEHGFRNWSLLAKAGSPAPAAAASVSVTAPPARDTRARYYLHGDQTEDDTSLYYCAQCDVFWPAEHFQAAHGPKTVERYLRSLRNWNSQLDADRPKWRRPENPVNILLDASRDYLAAEAKREKSRSRFHRWIVTQTERRDVIGDLAGDIKHDKTFPVAETSLDTLLTYMSGEGAIEEALDAMRAAYAEFSTAR